MRNLTLSEIVKLGVGLVSTGIFFKRTPRWSRDRMQAWQLKRVKALVSHAYSKIPFYRKLYQTIGFEPGDLHGWEDFEKLPLVSKDAVIENFPENMIQPGNSLDQLFISRSSGSSGKVLDIAYDASAMIVYIVAGLRLYKMCFNYRPWHRQAYIYTSSYPLSSLGGLYQLRFISTLTPIEEIRSALRDFRPHLLVCYPSHLRQIAESMDARERKKLSLKAISVNSEMSTQAERDYLGQLFDCPVLDEYSSEELTRIAGQCRHGTYHIFEDINYIEILDQNNSITDQQGLIVGTNLHNFSMPMIRYQQRDLGRIADKQCRCGWRFRHLSEFQGRQNDSFSLPSGKILTSGFLLDITYDFLLTHRDAVRDFCLIQRSVNHVSLQVVVGPGWTDSIGTLITKRFQEFLEAGMKFEIDKVTVCEKTKTGKRNPIINLISRAPGQKTS